MKKLKLYDNIIVFDFETSGLDPLVNKIIEFGAIHLVKDETSRKFVIKEEVDIFVNIGTPLEQVIIDLTNITDDMLQNFGVNEESLFDKINEFYKLDNVLFVAYNLQFDINFFNSAF